MIYGVKGNRKVQQAEAGELLMAYCCKEVVIQSSFVGVIFGIGRLIRDVQVVQMRGVRFDGI